MAATIRPTPKREWVQSGDRCAHIQSGATGTVERVFHRTSLDDARVLWDANGHSGIVRITMLRRVTAAESR